MPAEYAPPAGSEPVIVPVPEPSPAQSGAMKRGKDTGLWQPPLEQASKGKPEPPPVVRVSIGRVIVRAAPAAESLPATRAELPKPPLSLDEYLQRRRRSER
jgi:hypothetical protein